MMSKKLSTYANNVPSMFQKFLILFVVGLLIMFISIIILIVAAVLSNGSANLGVLIFIGPFPIVIGTGPESPWMVLFAIILAILSIITFLILRREMKKANV